MPTIQLSATPKGNGYQATVTFPHGVSISSEEAYPTIASAMSTSPWHASGAHQQMRSRPRSSSSAFIAWDAQRPRRDTSR